MEDKKVSIVVYGEVDSFEAKNFAEATKIWMEKYSDLSLIIDVRNNRVLLVPREIEENKNISILDVLNFLKEISKGLKEKVNAVLEALKNLNEAIDSLEDEVVSTLSELAKIE